ncbi:aryl-alcohol dehydrogenase-like predicted oxidoreductase [Crossiella equi]|uniref:Aryl-alcohol dehydrogenase-like predicted oxidoreductase n=1 Tax=Crossiella equi TaxID=130796 RepID=A0ABS5AAL3_9PSEU|nr:aldo/keto reductase [Crossiella equi]MBP2473629.1 aryl-alcohol dehydrogenase-like predicted oxidoreductase [Crossiella equi]
MRTISLGGRGGPAASVLCLGALPFGSYLDRDTSFAILDRFVEAGGTFIDTANNYVFWTADGTGAESENLLGDWLRSRGTRDQVVLASKVGALPDPAKPGEFPANAEGLSDEVIGRQLEASLRRLGTDHLDVYYAHIEDREVALAETVGAFGAAVAAGKVRVPGVSNHPTWRVDRARQLARADGLAPYQVLQYRHSYLRPRPDTRLRQTGHVLAGDELLEYVRREGDLVLTAYTSLLFGAYTRPDKPLPEEYDHPGTTRKLAVLREVAAELDATLNQVVLAWLVGGDPGVVPVLGVSSVAQLEESLAAASLVLSREQRERMDAAW